MSRTHKKRNKPYTGEDAVKPPTVHRYQAVVRSPLGEWWQDNKRRFKIGAIVAAIAFVVVYAIYELIRLF